MNRAATASSGRPVAALARGAALFLLWVMLGGVEGRGVPHWIAGACVAAAAALGSLRLLPPGRSRPHLPAVLRLGARAARQALAGGIDVSRRAFHPRLPLRPGLVRHPTDLPGGAPREAFAALTSLLPGTLPIGTEGDATIVYHCLDVEAPVAAELARDEALMQAALRPAAKREGP